MLTTAAQPQRLQGNTACEGKIPRAVGVGIFLVDGPPHPHCPPPRRGEQLTRLRARPLIAASLQPRPCVKNGSLFFTAPPTSLSDALVRACGEGSSYPHPLASRASPPTHPLPDTYTVTHWTAFRSLFPSLPPVYPFGVTV